MGLPSVVPFLVFLISLFPQAPSDEYFSVHIRRVGDWTEELARLCHVDEGDFQEAWKLPRSIGN